MKLDPGSRSVWVTCGAGTRNLKKKSFYGFNFTFLCSSQQRWFLPVGDFFVISDIYNAFQLILTDCQCQYRYMHIGVFFFSSNLFCGGMNTSLWLLLSRFPAGSCRYATFLRIYSFTGQKKNGEHWPHVNRHPPIDLSSAEMFISGQYFILEPFISQCWWHVDIIVHFDWGKMWISIAVFTLFSVVDFIFRTLLRSNIYNCPFKGPLKHIGSRWAWKNSDRSLKFRGFVQPQQECDCFLLMLEVTRIEKKETRKFWSHFSI